MGQGKVSIICKEEICTCSEPNLNLIRLATVNQDPSTWMKDLQPDLYVSSLSIPGTHQSLSVYGGPCCVTAAQCQNWPLQNQLRAGIRAFDIRGRRTSKGLEAYHSFVNQRINLEQAFVIFYDFLKVNNYILFYPSLNLPP